MINILRTIKVILLAVGLLFFSGTLIHAQSTPDLLSDVSGSTLMTDLQDSLSEQGVREAEVRAEIEDMYNELPENDSYIDIIEASDMDIREVLDIIAAKTGLTIISDPDVEGKITIFLKDVNIDDALRIILDINDLAYEKKEEGIVHVMTSRAFVERFGFSFGRSLQTRIIDFQYLDGLEVVALLEKMLSDKGKVILNQEDSKLILVDNPHNLDVLETFIKSIDVGVESRVFSLKYADVQDVAAKIKDHLTQAVGHLELKRAERTIEITDTKATMREIEVLIKKLDQEGKEINFKTTVIQIILNEEHDNGVDWEAIVSSFQSLRLNDREQLSFGTISAEDYSILLEALDTVGEMDTLTNSQYRAALNVEFQVETDGQDLQLFILPEQHIDDFLDINIKTGVEGTEFINVVNLELEDGATIVIGGIFDEVMVDSVRKIPLLGDLPLLGFAFRNQGKRARKVEKVYFITPKIVTQN